MKGGWDLLFNNTLKKMKTNGEKLQLCSSAHKPALLVR